MSRRSNAPRRVTQAKVRRELAEYDEHLSRNITRILNAYHAKQVKPLQEYMALPWYRRVFRRPPTP